MMDNLFSKIDVKSENINFLDGNAKDIETESARYTKAIEESGGITLQILGIGTNGHIGFNEPADEFTDNSFKVKLTQSTINSNQKFFCDTPMPQYAVTMGIGLIMKAKEIYLIATGEEKAQAVYDMVNGEVTPKCPASILQNHPNTTILLDEAAASML
ncbi:Glucosamine-6-phosphate deaminase [bioreactor metagenome]|uniref:Glucosamine-6-phosphate deaminase n=1 Tax=bioreactor metagenome TaxID=1076179 RepID=A0A645JG15_9ZZZZ